MTLNNQTQNSNPQTTITIPNYQIIETIYSGSRTIVYRGIRTRDQLPVVIKMLKNSYPTFSELVQFRNQYTIAKNLNSPLIIQTYSLEPYENAYALVMEDFGGISLQQWAVKKEQKLSLMEFLEIAISLCNTLDILYQKQIIHKDIKPSNILINPQTKQVKLIDFSIASLLPRESQTLVNPNILEGTLAYISPEQTGRMNRGIDYRTDFYSLGVTFYELLTEELPFQSNEPMELVHCHIAKPAPLVHEITPEIPSILSKIVSKLMAKNTEERYQSALGLKYDLETCLYQITETGRIKDFKIGQRDVSDRFIIPDKLYGRKTEVETILQAFERVSNPPQTPFGKGGGAEIMLVAGFSGIGKTAVVNEVHKPIVRQRSYFIKGKFDQFNRNIPFSAFVQAFRDLMGQLLTESDAKIQEWKSKILETVGENGQVIIEVIPELERIIGEQPPAPELSGTAAQNRFNLLFQKFTQIFTSVEHPLVMFLDDLQWADLASLQLMQLLMTELKSGYLLLIGAYRDNEVSPVHPLILTLDEIFKKGGDINTIILEPLSQLTLNQLVADTLNCVENLALPLSYLVDQKTKGNPFFATHFLKSLYQDGLIKFNLLEGYWQCDIADINQQALTDDVVKFMSLQLHKLPKNTQNLLKLAACIGNQFDLATLAIISEQSEIETAACLWNALKEGLIIPQSQVYKFYLQQTTDHQNAPILSYKFLHDRVQQAAYSLILESEKKAVHLQIGQLLLQNILPEVREAKIFDIVNQLNQGIDIITEQSAKDELAQLNLIAGKKAKASTAYTAAVKYFASGLELLLENSWKTHYKLTFELYRECAECEYLTGNLTQAEQLFDLALHHGQNNFDRADIYGIQMYLKMTQGENIQAGCDAGVRGLSIMGMQLPVTVEEQQGAIKTELAQLKTQLATVCPADLFNLPEMTDPVQKICMSLLVDLWAVTYMAGNQYLASLTPLLMLNLSLKYGNAESSGFAYCLYGMSLANQGDYQTAYEFGTLALKLDRHFNSTKFIHKTNNIFAHTINPYNQHLETNLALSQQGFQSSQEAGDIVFGVWAVSFLIWAMLIKGDRLSDVYAETEKYLSYVQQVNDVNMLYAFTLQRQFLLHLQDPTQKTDLLDEPNNNTPYINVWREKQNFEHGINWYCFLKLQLAYLYGRYADAVMAAEAAKKTLPSNAGFFPIIQYHFYYPLSLAALYETATSEQKQEYWNILEEHQQIVQQWARFCPPNFQHRYLLLSAEMAKISGQYIEAIEDYDRAIQLAKENQYLQEEALANELAAKFYLNWGKTRIAREYMTAAYYGYARWGAKAKVADLETRYPQLLPPLNQQRHSPFSIKETIAGGTSVTSTNSLTSISDALDLATILKASQTLSREIKLDKLLSTLLQVIIENAGADKAVLILSEPEGLMVKALAYIDFCPILQNPHPVEDSQELPPRLIHTVKRSLKPEVIIDARVHSQLATDPYIQQHQSKSILCSPILHQGKLLGIVYLENNLVTGAFTSDRVKVLNILCAQAAISLENARLYQKSQEYSQQLEHSLNELQVALGERQQAEASLAKEREFLNAIIHNITDGIVVCDASGKLILFNQATRDFHGLPLESLSLPPEKWAQYFDLYQPDGKTLLSTTEIPLFRALQGEIVDNAEIVIVPRQGAKRILLVSGQEIFDPWGNKVGAVVVMRDITERKKAEITLQQKSQALAQALNDLQQAQLKIVQSEKMSALGNLVSGIGHEMNNPLGFISASLQQAQPTVAEILEHLKLYQKTFPNKTDEIIEHSEEIDLDYTLEDLPKMIDEMEMACNRLRNISTSLRIFSRADKDYKVPFKIHEGIDSTILILKHRLKANEKRPAIEVITNYDKIPPIYCFPGQLNQVFMNIIANAIDALDESNTGRSFAEIQANPNRITIQTLLENEWVKIVIADNGKGMNEEVKAKIFDHLFTTKPVGKGTGLGLAIAKSIIVEKHGGTIQVNSILGEGTEFIITLPIQAEKN